MRNRIAVSFAIIICLFLLAACGKKSLYDLDVIETENDNVEPTLVDTVLWHEYEISIENADLTEENPWGFTAGVIDSEDMGNCVFLTPNTSFTISGLSKNSIVSLQATIHPWVADASDGAGIDVWIMNESNDILKKDSFLIENKDNWQNIQYSLADIEGGSKIKFLCNNGVSDDDSADWVIFKVSGYLSNFGKDGYVRSVTYFGNEWPINFWNSEMETLDEDFSQIRNDGFDSIILVIPWKEFQTSTNPVLYNEYAFNNLAKVMQKACDYDLDVYTRIGYTWDYYNDSNESITDRFLDLLRSNETRNAWLDYCKTLYDKLSTYTNFKDGFLTWEDFWNCFSVCDNKDKSLRIEYARTIGYQDWVKNNYSIEEYNTAFASSFLSYSDIPVPYKPEDSSMAAFYQFFDDFQNTLLHDTQNVFPNISIEVRLDWDSYLDNEGNLSYYAHTQTYSCESSDFTAAMYGIPMGCENKGERISADEALNHTEYILANLSQNNSGKPIYIEQFLFIDNTPQFYYNAKIKEEEIGQYCEGVSGVLLNYSKGYGIWTYRDYRSNMLYNSQFALKEMGWTIVGNPKFKELGSNGSIVLCMKSGDKLLQKIPDIRNHFPDKQYILTFDVYENESVANLLISFGNQRKQLIIEHNGNYELVFDYNEELDFFFEVLDGNIVVDNFCLYSFIQRGGLYDEYNSECEYIQNIRVLNEKLS